MNKRQTDMVVYYDFLFLINLIYQFAILFFTNRILRGGRSVVKIVLTAMLQCFLFVVITILTLERWKAAGELLSLAVSFLISAFLFHADSRKRIVKLFLTEFVLCILLGGILTLIHTYMNDGYLLLIAAGSFVFLGLFVDSLRELFAQTIGRKNCFYEVRLLYGEKQIIARGLLDSGNGLTDPYSKEPVCIITRELYDRLSDGGDIKTQSGYRLIPYHAIGKKNGILEAFFIDGMQINDCLYHKVLCAVSPDNFSGKAEYEIILHPAFLTE